jgi:exodeoxyribonuclease VII large subunit
VLTAFQRRAPHVRVIVYPSVVQGVEAPAALVSSLAVAARRAEVETLILCRGGGSLEDLWAFNDERVVRAIVASPIPVVCGVGHETDVSLADFAADLRAATPTAAAELAAPAREEALATLAAIAARLRRQLRGRLDAHAQRQDHAAAELARPAQLVLRHAMTLRHLDGRRRSALASALRQAQQGPLAAAAQLRRGATLQTARAHARLDALGQRLAALDPKRVLARGYAWVTDERGQPIVSVRALHVGQAVQAVWTDGRAGAQVLDVHPDP